MSKLDTFIFYDIAIIKQMFYNCNTNKREAAHVTEKESQLLTIIRGSKDPVALLAVAAQAITVCQRPLAPCGSPYPVAPASAAGTDP